MGWDLGKVSPHVKKAGEYFGKKYSIANIGGWRSAGSVPGSDHPKGLALDVMTSSRSKGDAIAADAIKNAGPLGVKYVIWYRKIWSPGRGWRSYSGPSPHTDHVHISFNGKAGSGKLSDVAGGLAGAGQNAATTVVGALSGIGDQIREIGAGVAQVGKVAEGVTKLMLPSNLLRVAAGGFGLIFILLGIFFMSREARA